MFQSFNRNNTSKSVLDLATSKKNIPVTEIIVCLNVIRFPLRSFIKLHWQVWHTRGRIDTIFLLRAWSVTVMNISYIGMFNFKTSFLTFFLSLFISSFFPCLLLRLFAALVLSYIRRERQNMIIQEQKSARQSDWGQKATHEFCITTRWRINPEHVS